MNRLVKVVIKLTFVIILMINLTSTGFSQGDCFNQQQGCSSWSPYMFKNVTIMGFPNCPIQVKYKTRTCQNPPCPYPITQVYLDEIWISELNQYCNALLTLLWEDYPNNTILDPYALADIYNEAYRELTRLLFLDKYNSSDPAEQELMKCPAGNPCAFPDDCNPAQFSYFIPQCTSICAYWDYLNGHYESIYKFIPCYQIPNLCCSIKRSMCWCEATQTVLVLEDYDQVYGDCNPGLPEGCPESEPPKVSRQLECFYMCRP